MMTTTRSDWQAEAWELYDLVGELRYYVSWRAASCSRVRLIASEVDPDTGLPTGGIAGDADGNLSAEGQRVMDIVKSIAGGPHGQSQMIKRSVESLTVVGEHYLAIVASGTTAADGTPEMLWLVITREEMKVKGSGDVEIEMPDGTKHQYNPAIDSLFRVWFPRARRAKEADSAVRATLDSLREIVRSTKKIKNASKSRLLNNGILFVPQEMSLPAAQAPIGANQPGAALPTVTGVAGADQLNNMLYNVMKVAGENDDASAAFIPLIATVPGEFLEKVQHMDIGRDVTAVEIQTRNDSIARCALGWDVSPERLLGIGSNTNHWSAWQVGDEDVQLHIAPPMETVCGAINDNILKAVFQREGIDPTKYVLWYDTTQLTADPDKTEEATEAHDRGAITNEAYRSYLGLSEDSGYDLSTIQGWQAWAVDAVTKNPELITTLLPLMIPQVQALDFPAPQALPPAEDPNQEESDDDKRENSEPDTESDSGSSSTKVQDDSYRASTPAELILAEQLLVNRALELAGKRRVKVNDREQKARLAGVAAHDYHHFMPPVAESDIPKLIDGWDSAIADKVISMLGADTASELREKVRRHVYRELTRPIIDVEAG
jgi:hypothetical protein